MGKIASIEDEIAHKRRQSPAGELDLTSRLVASLQCAGDGVIITNLEGRIEFMNSIAESLTGTKNTSVEHRVLPEVLRLRERWGNLFRHDLVNLALISGSPVSLGKETELVTSGGETRRIEGEISVRVNAGVATGTIVTFRDVTARVDEEARRLEEERASAVNRLAGAVAHELNNLLTVVLGHTELLEETYPDLAPLQASTGEIRRVTQQIAVITHQLLTLSRRDVLHPKSLAMNSLIELSVPIFRSSMPPNVQIQVALDPNAGNIFVDQAQMEQALTSLVEHCRDRMPDGGSITISTTAVVIDSNSPAEHLRRYIRLAIEDSGPTLRGHAVEELFEPSWDRDPGRRPGIGLFTVRSMIGAANGHLSIESDLPTGARFVMLFPEAEPGLVSGSNQEIPEDRPAQTILLVEDDDAIRILLRNAFEERGFRVIEARDGEEALLQSDLHDEPIDLLISDVVMPTMDGPSLTRILGAQRPQMKVILMSGCPVDSAPVRELVEKGAQFLLKPFTRRDLVAQAEKLLDAAPGAKPFENHHGR